MTDKVKEIALLYKGQAEKLFGKGGGMEAMGAIIRTTAEFGYSYEEVAGFILPQLSHLDETQSGFFSTMLWAYIHNLRYGVGEVPKGTVKVMFTLLCSAEVDDDA